MQELISVAAAMADGRVWVALAIACAAGAILLLLGVVTARRVGLLDPDGDAAETFGVGLSFGLVAFTAAWASVASGGRSVFVPVAVAIVGAIVVGHGRPAIRFGIDKRSLRAAAAAAAFMVFVGLLYASTIAPSPREGSQPVEFFDVGYYSVLGADLADTGRESIYSPAGFDHIAGLPEQTWYHWGELWLAAAAIDLTGVTPIHARHLIVLPLLLLAAAAMVGTLVRRLVSRTSTEFYVIGAAATIFLAPIPVLHDVAFEWFARGLVVSITQYGLAVVVILLGMHLVVARQAAVGASVGRLGGVLLGALIATHVGLTVPIVAAMAASILLAAAGLVRRRGDPTATASLRPSVKALLGVALGGLITVLWGLATGHGLGGLAPIEGIAPFDDAWQRALIETLAGAGILIVAPIGWTLMRREDRPLGVLAFASLIAVVAGAVGWGILASDLNTFHLFFGMIVTVLTPLSIVSALAIVDAARRKGARMVATVTLVAVLAQSLLAGLIGCAQLRAFGPLDFAATPVEALAALRGLPPGAKAAYACDAVENFAPWDASLVSLDAHTGVRMIPMCFMADRARRVLGRPLDPRIESPYFKLAPQRALYPDAQARPTTAQIRAFLAANDIDYVYADADHPNSLLPDAVPVFARHAVAIYRVD